MPSSITWIICIVYCQNGCQREYPNTNLLLIILDIINNTNNVSLKIHSINVTSLFGGLFVESSKENDVFGGLFYHVYLFRFQVFVRYCKFPPV